MAVLMGLFAASIAVLRWTRGPPVLQPLAEYGAHVTPG